MDGDQKPIGQALDGDEAPASSLPSATFTPSRSEPPAGISGETEAERNAVFAELVTGDADIVGLIAYSIYKQSIIRKLRLSDLPMVCYKTHPNGCRYFRPYNDEDDLPFCSEEPKCNLIYVP